MIFVVVSRVQSHPCSSSRMIVDVKLVDLLFTRPRRVHRYQPTMSLGLLIERTYPIRYSLIILSVLFVLFCSQKKDDRDDVDREDE